MLNLIFQRAKANDPSKVKVDCRFFFSENKKEEWFQAPYVNVDGTMMTKELTAASPDAVNRNWRTK